jgi:hypothetical protein
MDMLSFTFIVILLGVLGFAWVRLRSNWLSVQSMRADHQAAVDESGFDLPEGSYGSPHHGHGHEGTHHSGDVGEHDSGGFHGGDHGGFDGGGGHH